MIPLMRWTSRRFEDQWPVELMPTIVERLRGTPVRGAALLGEFTEAQIRFAREGWSAIEHIGHLDDLHLDMQRLHEFLLRVPVLSAADMTNRATLKQAGYRVVAVSDGTNVRFALNGWSRSVYRWCGGESNPHGLAATSS